MNGFLKLQGYDQESGKHFDLFVYMDRIVAVSPDMNMVYTAIGTFTISKNSMCHLMSYMKSGIYLDLTEEQGEGKFKGKRAW